MKIKDGSIAKTKRKSENFKAMLAFERRSKIESDCRVGTPKIYNKGPRLLFLEALKETGGDVNKAKEKVSKQGINIERYGDVTLKKWEEGRG